jgi:hypothetical protein
MEKVVLRRILGTKAERERETVKEDGEVYIPKNVIIVLCYRC